MICRVRANHLGAAVGPEEPGRLGGVVAGELEALAEAAGLGPERVEELGVAAAGGAVRQGSICRDRQDPSSGAGAGEFRILLPGGSRHISQAHQQELRADEYCRDNRAHRCVAVLVSCCCLEFDLRCRSSNASPVD